MKHLYFIDKEKFEVTLDDKSNYVKGSNEILIDRFEDLTRKKNGSIKVFL